MKILIAPNSMKGSLNAFDFADTVEKAFLRCSNQFEVRKVPVADGGDYTGEVLRRAFNAQNIPVKVHGPLGGLIDSSYSVFGKTAIIEMAEASGMKRIESHLLNPLKTSSFGTGELILDAIKKGCTEIFLAIGGSATVDGGMGMMEALDFRFYDNNKKQLSGNGLNLGKISYIQKPEQIEPISIKIICDVDNVLLGENGAAAVFGPQKGATPEMVKILESGLENWANIIQTSTGKKVKDWAGTGAAGGISVPLISFYDAEIVSGAGFVLSKLELETHVKWADIVITGEGKIDNQTFNNKAPFAVAKMANKHKKPVYAFAGIAETGSSEYFDGIFSISAKAESVEYAINNARDLLFEFSLEFAKKVKDSKKEINSPSKLDFITGLLKAEKAEEARKEFENLPVQQTVEYLLIKGKIEQKFQKWGDAINTFSRVIELDSQNHDAKNNLQLIHNILNFWNPEMFNP